jgi:hypothetical protein
MANSSSSNQGAAAPKRKSGPGKTQNSGSSSSAKVGRKGKRKRKTSGKKGPSKTVHPVSVAKFASQLEKDAKPWYQTLPEFPQWLAEVTLTVTLLGLAVAVMLERIQSSDDINAILVSRFTLKGVVTDFGDIDMAIIYANAIGVKISRVKEVLKLVRMCKSSKDFESFYGEAYGKAGEEPDFDVNTLSGAFINLFGAKPTVLKHFRIYLMDSYKKVAKIPEEVSDLEKDIQDIQTVIKRDAAERRKKIAEKRKELKALIDADSARTEELSPITDMIAKFNRDKSGDLSVKRLASLARTYSRSTVLKGLYTLEQFQQLYARKEGAAKVARCVQTVRDSQAFKDGQKLVGDEGEQKMDEGGGEEDEGDESDSVDDDIVAALAGGS